MHLRIIVTNPPADTNNGQPAVFGLQDKKNVLTPGTFQADGTLVFTCELKASTDDPPNFTGAYAQGTPQDRFLYLSYRLVGASGWIRRIKVPLAAITAADVARGATLEAVVDGRKAARVNVEWK